MCYFVEYREVTHHARLRDFTMQMQYKINVLNALKEAGYNTTRLRTEKIMGEAMIQKLRQGQMPSWATLETLCRLLHCQPGDLLEYVEEP